MRSAHTARDVAIIRLCVVFLFLTGGATQAREGKPEPSPASSNGDKSSFHLFNPTPRGLMRDMGTNRPDSTEGAYTLDAGHFAIELSFAEFAYDHRNQDAQTTRSLAVTPLQLRIGLLNNTELDLDLSPYAWTKVMDRPSDSTETTDGFGDVTLGLRQNLWGNDGGVTALAVVGSIKFPTASDGLGNDKVQGSLGCALGLSLPGDFTLGASATFDFVPRLDNDRSSVDFTHSIGLGHAIVGDLSGYLEYTGSANFRHDETYRGLIGTGLTYKLTDDLQLDAGVRVGLTTSADDLAFLAGISYRF